MISINKDYSLNQLRDLIHQNFIKNSKKGEESFDAEQKRILEIFSRRIFLEETIEEAIAFNRKLIWDTTNGLYYLTTTAEDLIEVFKLRSDVYKTMNYGNEFPDMIEGLNFDCYNHHSAIIFCKSDSHEFTGTSRIIFDSSQNLLPSDKKFSFNYLREANKKIAETSRLTIKKDSNKLSLDFKNIMKAYYDIITHNNLDLIVSSIIQDHYKLYSKFGGIQIEKELNAFGELSGQFFVISWNPYMASDFFKRSFLK